MASLLCRNGNFSVQIFDADRTPNQKRHALGTRNRKTALVLAERAADAHRLGKWDAWTDSISVLDERPAAPVTVGEAVRLFLTEKRRTSRTATVTSYGSVLNRFAAFVGLAVPLARITTADVDRFSCADGISPMTQRVRLRVIRNWLRWHRARGNVQTVVSDAVTLPPVPDRLPKAVSAGELEAVCESILSDYAVRRAATVAHTAKGGERVLEGELVWMVPLIRFAFYTGMRRGELGRMKWQDVDFARGVVRIEVQKNKKAQTVPLNAKAAAVLEMVERRGPTDYVFTAPRGADIADRSGNSFGNVVARTWTRYRKAAGIVRPLTFHCLRHGFATALAEAGRSAWVIQAACRHADVNTSLRYVSISNQKLRAELDGVFA